MVCAFRWHHTQGQLSVYGPFALSNDFYGPQKDRSKLVPLAFYGAWKLQPDVLVGTCTGGPVINPPQSATQQLPAGKLHCQAQPIILSLLDAVLVQHGMYLCFWRHRHSYFCVCVDTLCTTPRLMCCGQVRL